MKKNNNECPGASVLTDFVVCLMALCSVIVIFSSLFNKNKISEKRLRRAYDGLAPEDY